MSNLLFSRRLISGYLFWDVEKLSLRVAVFTEISSENHNAGNIRTEMAHQLYVYQTLMLNLQEARMSTAPDPQRDSVSIVCLLIANVNV